MGKIYPNVTGTPVQLYHYTALLKDSYQQAAWYSLGAIAILVFLHFRSLLCVVLALVPVAIGSLWLGGLMGWLGVPLNPANIMTLPLVIGIGVTNGIHILNRFAEEQTPSILAAQHRQGGAGLRVDGDGRFRQSDAGAASGHPQPGLRDDDRSGDLHDRGVDVPAGALEPADAPAGSRQNNPVPTMHDRHWVGRNRGKNLKYAKRL